jgi:hypothetical protein
MKLKSALLVLAFGLASTVLAAPITYVASLSGSAESPPNNSAATGFANVTFDPTAHTLSVMAVFSGLTSPTTASHIHCCTGTALSGTAGVATAVPSFPGFPLGVTSGTFNATFDTSLASSWNPAFISANGGTALSAEAALAAGLNVDQSYYNIHTVQFPNGEISGFLVAIPEPLSFSLTALAIGAILVGRKTLSKRKA